MGADSTFVKFFRKAKKLKLKKRLKNKLNEGDKCSFHAISINVEPGFLSYEAVPALLACILRSFSLKTSINI